MRHRSAGKVSCSACCSCRTRKIVETSFATCTAQVTSSSDYDPYGRRLTRQSQAPITPVSTVTAFGYAGEYTDPTGYIYLRNRYYDPTSAQFLTVDPLLQTTGDPYGYTAGNPLQFTDPLGLSWWNPATYDAITWDNIGLGLGVAAAVVAATGVGAPIALVLGGLAMAANGAAMYQNYQAGNCVAAAMGVLGFIPGGGKVGGQVGAEVLEHVAARGGDDAVRGIIEYGTDDAVALFRHVSPGELMNIQATGAFRPGINSLDGKWFAETAEHARQWGDTLSGGIGEVVTTNVPRDIADAMLRLEKLDGIGPARYADDLEQFNRAIDGIRVL